MSMYDKIVRPTTQMLLKRMETNPEDFGDHNSGVFSSRSWLAITKHGEFNLIERMLIKRNMVALRRANTEHAILELLLDGQAREEEESHEPYAHSTVGRFNPNTRVRQAKEIKEEYKRYNVQIDLK